MQNEPHTIFGQSVALAVFVLILATGCGVVSESYNDAQSRVREDALVKALKYIRQAIKDYAQDRGKPPHQLEDLVTSGYFNSLPVDPITNKPDWTIEFHQCVPATPCERLIKDVHSSSTEKSSKNIPYSEW